MKSSSSIALSILLALTASACGNGDGSGAASGSPAASGASATGTAAPAQTRIEKVTMNGVAWEVALPVDMKAPQYKVTNPEYLGGDMNLKLDATFPKFSTVEAYLERNAATKVLEKKQVGEAYFVVMEQQTPNSGKFRMVAMVPNQTIGWYCSGSAAREVDIRAMCASVKFSKP